MVEADVAVNFDPHSRTNTTDPMPTNRPILPFLVLTMAGGCGVSNLMKQAGNNSWVCVCGNGVGGRGVKSRHKCPCQSRSRTREKDALTATTSPKWLPVKALKKEKRQRCLSERDSLPSLLSGWLRRAELEQAARLSFGVSEAPSLLEPDFERLSRVPKTVRGKCDTKSHRILNRLLISSCFHPSLRLSVWLGWGGLGLDYPRKGTWTWLCLFAHVL